MSTPSNFVEFTHRDLVEVKLAAMDDLPVAGLYAGSQLVDGSAIASGDLVLLAGQADPSESGVYEIASLAGSTVRHASANSAAALTGYAAFVAEGATFKNKRFWQNNALNDLSEPQSWSLQPAVFSFQVPAGVSSLFVTLCGGGGGGGGGDGGGSPNLAGGGGGSGSVPILALLKVVPGETLVITVGVGGTFGLGSPNRFKKGTRGSNGDASIVSGSLQTVSVAGGNGGVGGGGNTGSAGGSVVPAIYGSMLCAGGRGGMSGTVDSTDGANSISGRGGPKGNRPYAYGSGGGGGAGRGDGAAGGKSCGQGPEYRGAHALSGSGGGGGGGGCGWNMWSKGGNRGGFGGGGHVSIAW